MPVLAATLINNSAGERIRKHSVRIKILPSKLSLRHRLHGKDLRKGTQKRERYGGSVDHRRC